MIQSADIIALVYLNYQHQMQRCRVSRFRAIKVSKFIAIFGFAKIEKAMIFSFDVVSVQMEIRVSF